MSRGRGKGPSWYIPSHPYYLCKLEQSQGKSLQSWPQGSFFQELLEEERCRDSLGVLGRGSKYLR